MVSPFASFPSRISPLRQGAWLGVALASLLVVFHHFALPLLPERSVRLSPHEVQPLGDATSSTYVYAFNGGMPDRPQNPHSRVRLFEDGNPLEIKSSIGRVMLPLRGGTWAHVPGYILFSASDNSDPRSNRHVYTLRYPPLASEWMGLIAAALFVLMVIALHRSTAVVPANIPSPVPDGNHWRLHLFGISAVLLAGLYCNTGTLAPYANTGVPQVDPGTGYLYNMDHAEFRAMFSLVDGAERSQWEQCLFLRRILYPVLAWPFMHFLGFETGGVVANLVFAWGGLMLALGLLRTRIGQRGAVLAGWLLAFYPGAAYWAGLPYLHGLIFPLSLWLTLAVMELSTAASPRRIAVVSLAMGAGYLAYDLAVFFLPSSLILLFWRRLWRSAGLSLLCQVLPMAAWFLVLRYGLSVPALNSNSGIYASVVSAYFQPDAPGLLGGTLAIAPSAAWHVWFGSNFLFLPLLALAAFALNPLTSRVRLEPAARALLAVAAALFLFTNLSPEVDTRWQMRGSWVSRIYQPVFPVLVFYVARWWQHLPVLPILWHRCLKLGLVAVLAGNAAVIFGPVLGNPLRLSSEAFYRFYTHSNVLLLQPLDTNLRDHGRRPLGFPRPVPVSPP